MKKGMGATPVRRRSSRVPEERREVYRATQQPRSRNEASEVRQHSSRVAKERAGLWQRAAAVARQEAQQLRCRQGGGGGGHRKGEAGEDPTGVRRGHDENAPPGFKPAF